MLLLHEYHQPPAALGYMLRAFAPSAGLPPRARAPQLSMRWSPLRIDPAHWDAFTALARGGDTGRQLLYPHVLGFRLVMALLTHPRFPLPIWRALQVRNHLTLHRPLPMDRELALEVALTGRRGVDKGVELDVTSSLTDRGKPVWDGVVTFFYRGRFGAPQEPSPLAHAPAVDGAIVARWHMPPGPGPRFGRLTGDYNGIHLWSPYARWFGFPGAFHHPQLVLAHCLSHLSRPAGAVQRLDAWLKGPVFYGRDVSLRARTTAGGTAFALHMEAEPRPCVVGRWSGATSPASRSRARASRTARWPGR